MTNGNGSPPEAAPPQLNVLAQYTKDLSFENPNAPSSLQPQQQQPAINIQINVHANNLSESEFEVALKIEGKAENAGKVMFARPRLCRRVPHRQRAEGKPTRSL
jgi:preprotein translocase subunit SecB